MNDPIISITVWRGPQSALAALLGIAPAQLSVLVKRRGLKRGGHLEIEVCSPTALRSLRHSLVVSDEEA